MFPLVWPLKIEISTSLVGICIQRCSCNSDALLGGAFGAARLNERNELGPMNNDIAGALKFLVLRDIETLHDPISQVCRITTCGCHFWIALAGCGGLVPAVSVRSVMLTVSVRSPRLFLRLDPGALLDRHR